MASAHPKPEADKEDRLCYKIMLRSPVTGKQRSMQIFVGDDGEAQRFVSSLNGLIQSVRNRKQPPKDITAWLDSVDDYVYGKLVENHLAEPTAEHPAPGSAGPWMTCEQLADWAIDKVKRRKSIADSTKGSHIRSWDYLATILGKLPINRLNLDLGNELMDKLFAGEGTVRGDRKRKRKPQEERSPSYVDTIFKHYDFTIKTAVREGLLPRNPFECVERPGQHKGARKLIDDSEARTILDTLPRGDQQIVWGLARYAGLRIPSELVELRWGDVVLDGDDPRVMIRSPKTKRYDGKDSRTCPLLFGLRDILAKNRPDGATDDDYVISSEAYRRAGGSANNRWLEAAIEAAGMERWPSLWRSARASAENDMRAIEGIDPEQVNSWIGHESKVARKHYREPNPEVRRRAAKIAA